MIIACRVHYLTMNQNDGDQQSKGDLVPPANVTENVSRLTPPLHRPLQMQIFPEMDLSVEIDDKRRGEEKRISITGKADRAFAHGDRTDSGSGTVLIAIKAKDPATFSQARDQLLTYLAIMRQLRKQEQKIADYVQGVYSDGRLYQIHVH